MEVYALFEGSYSVDKSKKFLPFDPKIHDYKDRPASLFIYVQPFLIKTKHDLLVFDTGLGYTNSEGKMRIHENILALGFDPNDVTKVLMSHLHYDHAGGMVWKKPDGSMELTFPYAQYVINRGEWEAAFSTETLSSYRTDIFDFVQRNADIVYVESEGTLCPEISYAHTGGHTINHQVFWVEEEGKKVFFGGDVLPEPEELIKNFIAKYDYDGRATRDMREAFGIQAAKEGWTCLFYHAKTKAIAQVAYENETFRIV